VPISSMEGRFTWKRLVCTALVLLVAQCLSAQSLSSLLGTVIDSTGAAIEGAKVVAKNNATGVQKNSVTTSAGTYNITDLNPGRYTVTVDLAGFQSSVHEGVNMEVGTTAPLT